MKDTSSTGHTHLPPKAVFDHIAALFETAPPRRNPAGNPLGDLQRVAFARLHWWPHQSALRRGVSVSGHVQCAVCLFQQSARPLQSRAWWEVRPGKPGRLVTVSPVAWNHRVEERFPRSVGTSFRQGPRQVRLHSTRTADTSSAVRCSVTRLRFKILRNPSGRPAAFQAWPTQATAAATSWSRSVCGTTSQELSSFRHPPPCTRWLIFSVSGMVARRRSLLVPPFQAEFPRSNCKPNYQSISNYFFQILGLPGPNGPVIDLSRQYCSH